MLPSRLRSPSHSPIRCLAALRDRGEGNKHSAMYLYYPLTSSNGIPNVLLEAFQSLKVESAIRASISTEKKTIMVDFTSRSFLETDPEDCFAWREVVTLLLQKLASDEKLKQWTGGSVESHFVNTLIRMEKIEEKINPEVELTLYDHLKTALNVADILSELLEALNNRDVVVIWKLATRNCYIIDILQFVLNNLSNSSTVFFPVLLKDNHPLIPGDAQHGLQPI
ncbi:MAG: hypothetical protein ACFFDT_18330, partial [Candidatus Hodarchaeota archaeon]